MSWTDVKAIQAMHAMRDQFGIRTLIETGTHKGVNAYLHAAAFERVFTVEISASSMTEAYTQRLYKCPNVLPALGSSPQFLKHLIPALPKDEMLMLYLDAHFYDPSLPKHKRFVVLDELAALASTPNCLIIIHDFENKELGHITYDGIPLGAELLREALYKVNPKFHFYSNTKQQCEIVTKEGVEKGLHERIPPDPEVLDNLSYVWSSPQKTYRGILYCSPDPLSDSIDLTPFDIDEGKLLRSANFESLTS